MTDPIVRFAPLGEFQEAAMKRRLDELWNLRQCLMPTEGAELDRLIHRFGRPDAEVLAKEALEAMAKSIRALPTEDQP